MAFIRIQRIKKKNGKVYEYRRLVRSVRIPGVGPRQIDMGKVPDPEPSVPAMIHDEYMDKFNAEHANEKASAKEAGKEAPAAPDTGDDPTPS